MARRGALRPARSVETRKVGVSSRVFAWARWAQLKTRASLLAAHCSLLAYTCGYSILAARRALLTLRNWKMLTVQEWSVSQGVSMGLFGRCSATHE